MEFHQLLAQTDFSVIEFWIDDHFDRQTHRWLSAIVRKKFMKIYFTASITSLKDYEKRIPGNCFYYEKIGPYSYR